MAKLGICMRKKEVFFDVSSPAREDCVWYVLDDRKSVLFGIFISFSSIRWNLVLVLCANGMCYGLVKKINFSSSSSSSCIRSFMVSQGLGHLDQSHASSKSHISAGSAVKIPSMTLASSPLVVNFYRISSETLLIKLTAHVTNNHEKLHNTGNRRR